MRSPEVFREAWQAGYRTFDTAVYYGNDAALFAALTACDPAGEARVVHKVQPVRVTAQFERLIRPKLDGRPLDTLLLHHPALFVLDAGTEALMGRWRELEALVDRGLVRRIGCSNAGRGLIGYLHDRARVKPSVNQIECHPWNPEPELRQACLDRGIEVQCYSPLGGTRLPVRDAAAVREVARATGRSPAQVCLAWLLGQGLVPVVRATRAEHMRDNLQAESFALDASQVRAIEEGGARGRVWDDPVKRGCLAATVAGDRITVPNRARFALRSALHYATVGLILNKNG